MVWIAGALFAGIIFGGVVFPWLWERFERFPTRGTRALLVSWLIAAAVVVMPGLEAYVFNEPLRVVANFCLGLSAAPTYGLFFSRFPLRWRGMVFGLVFCLAILCWNVLTSLSFFHPPATGDTFHPFQESVFSVHAGALALLAVLSVAAYLTSRTDVREAAVPPVETSGAENNSRLVAFFLASAFIMNVLVGIMNAQNTPVFPPTGRPLLSIIMAVTIACILPVAGWLYDRHPARMLRRLLSVCCWVIIASPALALIGDADWFLSILRACATVTDGLLFVLGSVAVAHLSPSAGMAVRNACGILIMRFFLVAGYLIWVRWLEFGKGSTVLAALVLAYALGQLVERIMPLLATYDAPAETVVNPDAAPERSPVPDRPDQSDKPDRPAGNAAEARCAFLDACNLTSREREIAELLIDGRSIMAIAIALDIAENTVKKHAASLYKKAGVDNRHSLYQHYIQTTMVSHGATQPGASDEGEGDGR